MKMRKIGVIALCMIMLFSGCGKERTKVEIPENMELTKLSDILKNFTDYHEKNVLLSGFVVSVCPSGCDMVYQEGSTVINIYAKGFKFQRMKKGQPIKVYAEVTAGKERVIISALTLEVVK